MKNPQKSKKTSIREAKILRKPQKFESLKKSSNFSDIAKKP